MIHEGNSALPPGPPAADAWLRAVAFATGAPDVSEALGGVLSQAVPAARAGAGAVFERGEAACRAVWGCEASALCPLLQESGAVRQALARLEEWIDEPLLLTRAGEEEWPTGCAHLLLVPLQLRGLGVGTLLLLYGGDLPPGPEERALAVAYAGLAAFVLENDRLYEEAREALQARDHFLTALNHELRTPATALLLEAELLGAKTFGEPEPALAASLRRAEEHVREMIAVLRRVLDLGQLSDRGVPTRPDVVHPRQVVLDLLRRIEPAAKRKKLTLAIFVPRHLPPLQTDVSRFSRILLHLFSNAIKYTAGGGVEVRLERTVRLVARHKQEPVLAVRVKDTGCGIPEHELARIFEPFTQVDEGARSDSRNRGLGLGLPLARGLARSLGGDIQIESRIGHGTTASLVLPYHQPAE